MRERVELKDDEFGAFVSIKIRNSLLDLARKYTAKERKPPKKPISLDDEAQKPFTMKLRSNIGLPEKEVLSKIGVKRIVELAEGHLSPLEMVAFRAIQEQGGPRLKSKEISPELVAEAERLGMSHSSKNWDNLAFRTRKKLKPHLKELL
ncbi:hypothetical protein HZC09_01245 [Candidatus Micrarchaeota archaeon]|nr:hypothetical protein [Candidatus Micrarchaeota archaeon]